ncbi:MAG: hypothetical protein U5N85_19225 [Arcicella sp.]|nr:hypothetical protein [Arcicella sp.]
MKKITLLFLATFLTFIISSCSKTEETATPVTVVGKWTLGGLGVITDKKTVDVTTAELSKIDPKIGEGFATYTFELKADGTSNTPDSDGKLDAGKYTVSADNKLLTITSNFKKDSKGVLMVQKIDIVTLSASEMKLGIAKLSNKGTDGDFIVDFFSNDFLAYVFASYVFAAKGLNAETEVNAAKTLQTTYNLKR